MKSIKVEKLHFSYDKDREVLRELNFEIRKNESVGIIGANGAGKSTLLKLFIGLLDGYKGSIKINELSVEKDNLNKIRKCIGYVFQDSDSQLFMPTVYEDVAFAPLNYGYSKEETDSLVMDALEKVHIEQLKDRQIYRMSGGQKKLVSIASVLAMQSEIMLLDEPSIALDPKNRRNLINILNEIEETKIIASHDLDMILDTCERTILLHEGKIERDGNTKDILTDKELLERCGLEMPLSLYKREI